MGLGVLVGTGLVVRVDTGPAVLIGFEIDVLVSVRMMDVLISTGQGLLVGISLGALLGDNSWHRVWAGGGLQEPRHTRWAPMHGTQYTGQCETVCCPSVGFRVLVGTGVVNLVDTGRLDMWKSDR